MHQLKKILFLFFIICITAHTVQAQYPKYIVQFKDKQNNSFSISSPSTFLSAKAIQRRTKYKIGLDTTDLPVSPSYIAQVQAQGALTVLSQSKWLNQILIYCTDATVLAKVQALPFVVSTKGIGYRTSNPSTVITTPKFAETIAPNLEKEKQNRLNRVAVDYYDYGNSYGQIHIHEGEFLHNKGYRGEGVTISVLDAGFYKYLSHSGFDSVRNQGRILGIKDFVAFDNSVDEDNNHGSSCLSIIAANKPGTMVGSAPNANFYLLRTENAATEYPIEEYNWVVGAEYADSCGADIITSSLGYNTFDDPSFDHTYADFYQNSTTISKGATFAARKGILVTNSAGNEGNGSWRYILFPADVDSVCTVAAIDVNKNVASFSSWGYGTKQKPNVTSVGAGTAVAFGDNGFGFGNGTSYSNPNMCGLIACLWQAFPEFNNMAILDAVYKSCPTYTTPDNRIGYGIPNMRIAYGLLEEKRRNQAFESLLQKNWLVALPTPFTTQLTIKLQSPETGKIALQLLDAGGKLIESKTLDVLQNTIYDVQFNNVYSLPSGVYFVTYRGQQKKTIKIVKQ